MPQPCASCAAQSPDGAKFCLECGSPLSVVCRSCGHPVVGGKFCIECGTPLAAAGQTSAPVGGPTVPVGPVSERRTTTVLFGDMVGFTTLSESHDPEDPFEQLANDVVRALAQAGAGDVGGAAVRSARAARAAFEGSESMEDFEIMWAPMMELQVRAGHLEEADGLMELAHPLLGEGARPLARAEVPRIRALLKAARGEDPEADLRTAEAVRRRTARRTSWRPPASSSRDG